MNIPAVARIDVEADVGADVALPGAVRELKLSALLKLGSLEGSAIDEGGFLEVDAACEKEASLLVVDDTQKRGERGAQDALVGMIRIFADFNAAEANSNMPAFDKRIGHRGRIEGADRDQARAKRVHPEVLALGKLKKGVSRDEDILGVDPATCGLDLNDRAEARAGAQMLLNARAHGRRGDLDHSVSACRHCRCGKQAQSQ